MAIRLRTEFSNLPQVFILTMELLYQSQYFLKIKELKIYVFYVFSNCLNYVIKMRQCVHMSGIQGRQAISSENTLIFLSNLSKDIWRKQSVSMGIARQLVSVRNSQVKMSRDFMTRFYKRLSHKLDHKIYNAFKENHHRKKYKNRNKIKLMRKQIYQKGKRKNSLQKSLRDLCLTTSNFVKRLKMWLLPSKT